MTTAEYSTETRWGNFAPLPPTQKITAMQPTQYDSRTGIIEPLHRTMHGAAAVAALTGEYPDLRFVVVESGLVGWGGMTHLVAPESGGYALVRIEER